MARILYGVAGEGYGHSSRAKEVLAHLVKQGHTVKVISYDKGYKILHPLFDVTEIFGLHFVYQHNQVQPISTVIENLSKIREAKRSFDFVIKLTESFKPQIVFSDFEPLSALIANLKKIPFVSIDNQHRLTHTRLSFPPKYAADFLAAAGVVRMMMAGAKAYLIIDAFGGKSLSKKAFIFPPILRQEILALRPRDDNYILVYLTSACDEFVEILKKFDQRFVLYGLNREGREGNVVFKKSGTTEFLRDLSGCSAIVANAGFSLISEALYLRKPYLAIPVAHQFEQVLNAYYLQKFGYGLFVEELSEAALKEFLSQLPAYRKNLRQYKKEDNKKILRKVDELVEEEALA